MPKYHFYKQHDHSDCGATCLRIIFRYQDFLYLETLFLFDKTMFCSLLVGIVQIIFRNVFQYFMQVSGCLPFGHR